MKNEVHGDPTFDRYFKGKYVYNINWEHLVLLDNSVENLIRWSKGEDIPGEVIRLDYETYKEYIDKEETDRVNDPTKYKLYNQFTSDENLTWDEIRVFRTWLAKALLTYGIQYDSKTQHMLEYYRDEMYDGVCRGLTEFGGPSASIIEPTKTGCGCSHTSDMSSLYQESLSVCDPISIYRRNVYNTMVSTFSEVEFWKDYDPDLIENFKKYVDNIIKMNLTLDKPSKTPLFVDCGCETTSLDRFNKDILQRLSRALDLIAKKELIGNMNYISEALNDWATHLYENMRW